MKAEIVVDTFYCNQTKRKVVFRVWLPIFDQETGDFLPVRKVIDSGISCVEIILN